MDNGLRELYQEVILDHGRRPRHFRAMAHYSHAQESYNPICGDQLMLYLRLAPGAEGGAPVIEDIAFQGTGCAISIASASLLCECLRGKTAAEADALFQAFHRLLTEGTADAAELQPLGKLRVLAGVREFPSRIKCATLAWHALQGALHPDPAQGSHCVTTE